MVVETPQLVVTSEAGRRFLVVADEDSTTIRFTPEDGKGYTIEEIQQARARCMELLARNFGHGP